MKSVKLLVIIFSFLLSIKLFSQEKPLISFEDLVIQAEKNFDIVSDARKLAEAYNLPHTIYLPEGVFIEAKGIENNLVVYSIINDLLHPFK